jgi:hypothetical protein
MITTIKALDLDQQRRLIRLLDSRVDLSATSNDEVFDELIAVLRDVLQVPADGDVPQYLRRRLVEVTMNHFQLRDSLDSYSDIDVALVLADFALEAARQLAENEERREEFELFLRTKDKRERTRWLVESERFASLMTDGTFDEAAARRRAREVNQGSEAHRVTANTMLRHLAVGSAAEGAAAAASGATGAFAATAATAAIVATAGAAALPLGAVAGALFLAGRRKRNLLRGIEQDAVKTRARRARNSRLVQSVVALSVFVVASTEQQPT